MKAPTTEILAAARQMLADGVTIKVVLNTPFAPDGTVDPNGELLGYSQFWLYHSRQNLLETTPNLDFEDLTGEAQAEMIVDRRNQGYSWGEIAVQANKPEGRIRKIFEETTGVRSKGLRTGQGGRFLTDDQVFYDQDRKVTGTAIPVEKKIGEAKAELYKAIEKAREARKPKAKKAKAAK